MYLPPLALSTSNLNFTESGTPETKYMGESILKDPKIRVYYIFLSPDRILKMCSKGKHVFRRHSSEICGDFKNFCPLSKGFSTVKWRIKIILKVRFIPQNLLLLDHQRHVRSD